MKNTAFWAKLRHVQVHHWSFRMYSDAAALAKGAQQVFLKPVHDLCMPD
jgi:hypothetical protein